MCIKAQMVAVGLFVQWVFMPFSAIYTVYYVYCVLIKSYNSETIFFSHTSKKPIMLQPRCFNSVICI